MERKADTEVLTWIENYTEKDDVFTGTMPMTSKIFLMSTRKIASNPYCEDEINRNKTYELYRVYGRETESGFIDYLHKNMVDYLVIDNQRCYSRDTAGCTVEDLYKIEDKNNSNPILSKAISQNSTNMKLVFDNDNYRIFKILK